MSLTQRTAEINKTFNQAYLADEDTCLTNLRNLTGLSHTDRKKITKDAIDLIQTCRDIAGHGELFDAFLQEYGLSTQEGVTLMRLAEALIRTPDTSTARLLLRDKLSDRDWKSHQGKSNSNLVNFSTNGMSFSASWIRKTGGKAAEGLLAKFGDTFLHKGVTAAMGVMSGHFVLGRDIDHAIKKSEKFEANGFSFSYDMLGEAAHTLKDAERYRVNYQNAIDRIAKNAAQYDSLNAAPGISVKLSALHPRYEYAQRKTCVPALLKTLKEMALAAKKANIGLTIDAEEADRLEVSLLAISALIADQDLMGWDGLTIVVQAYQRRAVLTIQTLLAQAKSAGRKIAIRLVKGAYWDMEIKRAQEMGLSSYPVFTRKENTDVSYLACARILLNNTDLVYPQFATHNAATAIAIMSMAGNERDFEFQRLHGMGEVLHRQLMKQFDIRSRIYAPVGAYKDLLPYLVRRLLENGANSSFVNQFLDETVAPADMSRDPIEQSLNNEHTSHPGIPSPRDLFAGRRLSAKGLDTTQAANELRLTALPFAKKPIIARSIINGQEIDGDVSAIFNPAKLDEVVGHAAFLSRNALSSALAAAKKSEWKTDYTPKKRAECLEKAAELLESNMNKLMTLCIREAGKTWIDAVAEIREAVDFCRYYAQQARHADFTNRKGLGTIACISPWNFPLAIFLGQVTASLAAGNAVICKPAEQTPLIAYKAVKILHDAGIPKCALHLAIGTGAEIGSALTADSDIDGICFTGSTVTAKLIATTLAETGRPLTPLIAETGGLNAMIVDSTALLEQAVSDVVASAFQSAGQRCSACRIVCLQAEIADDFIEMLAGSIDVLNIGNPHEPSTDVGPVINHAALDMLKSYVEECEKKWTIVGEHKQKNDQVNGLFFNPIAFEVPSISELETEKFGPILHLVRYKADDIDNLISDINKLGYGLTMGLHTRIDSRVEQVSKRAEVGNLYINRNQIGAVVGVQPFGGEGLSGTGPKAGGPLYMKRLSRPATNFTQHHQNSTMPINILRDDHPPIAIKSALTRSKIAQLDWHYRDKIQILKKIISDKTVSSLVDDLSLMDEIITIERLLSPIALPGPTGEENRLSFHPRGTLLVLGDADPNVQFLQIFKAIAMGNSVILVRTSSRPKMRATALDIFFDAGVPNDVIMIAESSRSLQNLLDKEIQGVVCDGEEQVLIAKHLCFRDGAILPILSAFDDLERYIIERTITIDTTAAGGNASLLAM